MRSPLFHLFVLCCAWFIHSECFCSSFILFFLSSCDIFVLLCAAKPLFNGALWATQLWPLKRLRTSTVIHAAFTADARASKTSSILSYLLRTLSSLMGSLAILLIECHSGQHQS